MACFVQPMSLSLNIFSLLSYLTKKSSNSSQYKSRNQIKFGFLLDKLTKSIKTKIYKPLWMVSSRFCTTSSSPTRQMNSLLAAEGRKLNSGAGGLGGGISRRVFSSCFRRASLAAAWRLAGESFTLTTEMPPLPEEEPFKLDGEAFENEHRQERNETGVNIQSRSECLSVV